MRRHALNIRMGNNGNSLENRNEINVMLIGGDVRMAKILLNE